MIFQIIEFIRGLSRPRKWPIEIFCEEFDKQFALKEQSVNWLFVRGDLAWPGRKYILEFLRSVPSAQGMIYDSVFTHVDLNNIMITVHDRKVDTTINIMEYLVEENRDLITMIHQFLLTQPTYKVDRLTFKKFFAQLEQITGIIEQEN